MSSPLPADRVRLERTLGRPALARLVTLLARRIMFDVPLTGRQSLSRATEAERRALGELVGGRPAASIDLDRLDETLRASQVAPSLKDAVQALAGPIVPRSAEKAAEQAACERALAVLRDCVHSDRPWFEEWVRTLPVTRLVRAGSGDLIARAVAVLNRLPAAALPLSVLAERATGDTKALLPDEPLGRLLLRGLALRASLPPAVNREAQRALWATAGVIVDDLASQVLVLNLPATGGMVASWLTDAAGAGLPFRLTLQQLTLHPVIPAVPELFVCENPAILRAAAAELGAACAPLICTEGVPSAACHALLESAVAASVPIHWRADFDWAGLRMVANALQRYAAVPWRMSATDFTTALASGSSEPLRGFPATSPWDPLLASELGRADHAVMEERILDDLLADLAGETPHHA
jgi:uncharacterized protein (TIGR02679 family)